MLEQSLNYQFVSGNKPCYPVSQTWSSTANRSPWVPNNYRPISLLSFLCTNLRRVAWTNCQSTWITTAFLKKKISFVLFQCQCQCKCNSPSPSALILWCPSRFITWSSSLFHFFASTRKISKSFLVYEIVKKHHKALLHPQSSDVLSSSYPSAWIIATHYILVPFSLVYPASNCFTLQQRVLTVSKKR